MVVAAPSLHDSLPKRGSGCCRDCARREHTGELSDHGHRLLRCAVHGHPIQIRLPACTDYERGEDRRAQGRVWARRYHAEITTGVRQVASRPHVWEEPKVEPKPVAILPILSRCARCGSTMVYRDDDGTGCVTCGHHTWERGSEPLYGYTQAGDAMRQGHRVEAWGY